MVAPRMSRLAGTNGLLVPPVKRSTVQPSVAVLSRLLARRPVTPCQKTYASSLSEYVFRRQLKTWLFKKSFPDIII